MDPLSFDTNQDGIVDEVAVDTTGDGVADTWYGDQDQDGIVDEVADTVQDGAPAPSGEPEGWTDLASNSSHDPSQDVAPAPDDVPPESWGEMANWDLPDSSPSPTGSVLEMMEQYKDNPAAMAQLQKLLDAQNAMNKSWLQPSHDIYGNPL